MDILLGVMFGFSDAMFGIDVANVWDCLNQCLGLFDSIPGLLDSMFGILGFIAATLLAQNLFLELR